MKDWLYEHHPRVWLAWRMFVAKHGLSRGPRWLLSDRGRDLRRARMFAWKQKFHGGGFARIDRIAREGTAWLDEIRRQMPYRKI